MFLLLLNIFHSIVKLFMMFMSIQWAPSGNLLDGIPGQISRFLADENGKTPGYAPDEGWAFTWHHGAGIALLPAQFLVKYSDGSFEVVDTDPLA